MGNNKITTMVNDMVKTKKKTKKQRNNNNQNRLTKQNPQYIKTRLTKTPFNFTILKNAFSLCIFSYHSNSQEKQAFSEKLKKERKKKKKEKKTKYKTPK